MEIKRVGFNINIIILEINTSVETMILFLLSLHTPKRSHTMTKLLEQLTKLFTIPQQSRLEQYINSKNPSNAADVDYWQRQYETEAKYWGGGL
jgi:hypothetical protein